MAQTGYGPSRLSLYWNSWVYTICISGRLEANTSQLGFFGLTFVARSREKIFHYLFTVSLLVGSVAYFAMASDLAWDVISQANETQNGDRQIFFAKYVYWVVSFPVVTIALGLVSGVSC